jgi:hypothetical protein
VSLGQVSDLLPLFLASWDPSRLAHQDSGLWLWLGTVSFYVNRNIFILVYYLDLSLYTSIPSYFDDEAIPPCLAYRYPRDAMILRAPETEALDEGYAQKGFEVSILDGSPFPLDSTALPRSLQGILPRKWSGEKPSTATGKP